MSYLFCQIWGPTPFRSAYEIVEKYDMSGIDRILLVDDEPVLLGPLRRWIQRSHPEALVVYASDPQLAEWQLRSTPIRLVVTDMRMHNDPEAGLRVVAAAREAGVPVVVLTGADDHELAKLAESGLPVISKRSSIAEQLSAIVERVLSAA